MNEKKYEIVDFLGNTVEVIPRMFLYAVKEFLGNDMTIPGIQLYSRTENGEEPYATLTKSFGEFIGAKNTAYIDTNNCPFAVQLLEQGFAKDTGFTKTSGRCTYPLWAFEENFLKEIGGAEYERYSRSYDEYMKSFSEGENKDV